MQAATALTAETFTRDLGGSFCSVRDTLIHIIGGEWISLVYWRTPPGTPAELAHLMTRRDALFKSQSFPNLAAVRLKLSEIEKEQTEFVDQVTDELSEKKLPFRTTEVRLAHLMQHVANHST